MRMSNLRPISELCTRITSGGTPSRKREDFFCGIDRGHRWVKSKELLDCAISESEEHITDDGLKNSSAKYLPANTVLVAMYGANVGQMGWLRSPATVNQAICGLAVNPDIADFRYVYYALLATRDGLIAKAQGAAQQNLNQDTIKAYDLPAPHLSYQRRIASILSAYDDLIENNTRRIAILEEMARRIYEEWFVRFRFPGHEQVKMVESELGLIPEGWSVERVANVLQRLTSGTTYKKEQVQESGSVMVVDQSTLDHLGFHDMAVDHSASVENPIAIFGDHTCKLRLMVRPFSIGPNTIPFVGAKDLDTSYVFQLVQGLVATHEYKRHWTDFTDKKVIKCPQILAAAYGGKVRDLIHLVFVLTQKNQNLRTTRDLLLPKLISGELDVSNLPEPESIAA